MRDSVGLVVESEVVEEVGEVGEEEVGAGD